MSPTSVLFFVPGDDGGYVADSQDRVTYDGPITLPDVGDGVYYKDQDWIVTRREFSFDPHEVEVFMYLQPTKPKLRGVSNTAR